MNRIFVLLLVVLAAACATPIAPTGGPPDRTPPIVERTTPENGTVNFDDDEVRFHFSKHVDRNSARNNITIEPNLGIRHEVSFSGQTVIVRFQDPLPENTTVIVQVGTDVSDTRRNTMSSPFNLAISTGPVLDDGEITARVRHATEGRVDAGERVFLYREPFNLDEPANYVAQSDTAGRVQFSFIAEGRYKAIWVDDINRDRRWNRERERAQPFTEEFYEVAQGEAVDIGTVFIQRPDTIAPRIEGVGQLSERRLRLRLSEPVEWGEDAYFSVRDSINNEFTRAYPLYGDDMDRNVLFAQTDDPLPPDQEFMLDPLFLTDKAGNNLRDVAGFFPGSAQPDTTILRIITHSAERGVFPDEPITVTYSRFINDAAVVDSLGVLEGDRMITEWPFLTQRRHELIIRPDGLWQPGARYRFDIWDPDFQDHLTLTPDIWQRSQLGGIEFTVPEEEGEEVNRLLMSDSDGMVSVDTTFTGSIEIDRLPPLQYNVRIFRDLDGSGQWSPGSVDPFEAPEPYFLQRQIPVREGFTSEVTVTFGQARMPGTGADPPADSGENSLQRNGTQNNRP
ncbi:MAG: Ig-like domain-containing protein [Balneolaceae bacterium]